MRLAVLIPVYNAAAYLPQCLESVLSQDVPDLEVFCCDDGSTDGSAAILADYARRQARVHVLTQPNGGVVAARNRLLDELPSDIDAIAFLDADDYIAPGMYRTLAAAMERTGADVAECGMPGNAVTEECVIDDLSVYLLRGTAPGAWINVVNKLYRRAVVGSIRFREGLRFEEDFFYNYEVHAAIRRKVILPQSFYTYRDNPDSATSSLNLRRYFDSTARRIRLSLEVFLMKGRIPAALKSAWRAELAKDAYRMCLRKNLKKNRDAKLRRELFLAAGEFFAAIERDCGFSAVGLNPVQKALYRACRAKRYLLARLLVALT